MKARRLPAEWEAIQAVMLTWPHADSDWAAQLDEAEAQFRRIADQIIQHSALLIVCRNAAQAQQLHARYCDAAYPLRTAIIPSNDSWARDHGPISVYHGDEPLLLNFRFNAWGNKYEAELDNAINEVLAQQVCFGNTRMQNLDFVLEGGSIESDGEGTLLTTSACLLSPQRNPGLAKADIEQRLRTELGVTHMLWLDRGYLSGDDTDAHIDTLARLCPNDTIAYVQCNNPSDEHFGALADMEHALQGFRNRHNRPYRLIPLPLPSACYDGDQRLPATYANFLVVNQAVLLPVYSVAEDQYAAEQVQLAFPDHKIIGVNCETLIQQHGSLHCVTMQLPFGVV